MALGTAFGKLAKNV